MRLAITLLLLLVSARVDGQTWDELEAVGREMPVRVYELGGKGWTWIDGKLLLVKDDELTILKNTRPVVIPKSIISRVETRRGDPPWEGLLLGALANIVLGSAGGWQGCSSGSSCVVAGITAWAGLGAFIDWKITKKRTVYRAP